MQTRTKLKRLILVGGGHAHAIFLRMWAMHGRPDTEVLLVSPQSRAAYSGRLPAVVAGLVPETELYIDLRSLAKAAGATFIDDAVLELDLDKQRIMLRERAALSFDFLSLNTGSLPRMDHVPGAAHYAQGVKPIPDFLRHWEQLRAKASSGLRLVLVGGGAGGVELAFAMRAAARLPATAEISLVQAGPELLPQFNPSTRRLLSRLLQDKGVRLHTGAAVERVEADELFFSSGETLPFDALYWVTEASAPPWIKRSGLRTDSKGFAITAATLLCEGQRNIFAVGDCASIRGQERPKSGVYSVRLGPPLFENLRAALSHAPLREVRVQKQALALIGTGDGRAVASRASLTLAGKAVWKLKEAIDARFMQKFQALPQRGMDRADPKEPLPRESKFRCSGCGAKVPAHILSEVLQSISRAYPSVVAEGRLTWGLPAREDVSLWQAPAGARVLQSIDYFPALLDDPFRTGQIACQHAFNDVLVKGAEPHSALALAVLPWMAEHLAVDQLYQLLAGVCEGLRDLGASLAGGHSAEGQQLAIGLTVTGLSEGRLLRKETGRAGDLLILTKALGTGAIFAGEMQGRTRPEWVDAAVASMMQSHRALLPLIRRPEVHAATDITGFGLLGHLAEMLRSGQLIAELWTRVLPALPGALSLSRQGIASSLSPANRRFQNSVKGEPHDQALWSLLADPQTSGGFLLSVAPEASASILATLRELGFTAASVIGTLRAQPAAPEAYRIELVEKLNGA